MSYKKSIDTSEIIKFQAMAEEWWDPNGKFKPLHMMNPCRLGYIVDQIRFHHSLSDKMVSPFVGLRILDIGCGGGLLAEPMARLGASVVGADPAERNISVASIHAKHSDLEIDYRNVSAETLVDKGEKFNVVLNMEVVEHVAEPAEYLKTCYKLLEPNGLMICSTINRNIKSYLNAIIGAEYIMRWLPKGTHDWQKFLTPDELCSLLDEANLKVVDKKGFVFNKILWKWYVSNNDLSINYVTSSVRREKQSNGLNTT